MLMCLNASNESFFRMDAIESFIEFEILTDNPNKFVLFQVNFSNVFELVKNRKKT